MIFVQKWPFFHLFFLDNIAKENVPYDILERKNAFLGCKKKNYKKSKNWHFLWLWSKNGYFSNFFLGNIGQENVFYDILKRKNAFWGYKNKKLKKSKNWHFSMQFVKWNWSKNWYHSNFFFRQYRPGKCLLRYSRARKRLSRL